MRQCFKRHEGGGLRQSNWCPQAADLTIQWTLTDIVDDPEGKLFAKLREGLHKWLHRRGITFAAILGA